MKMKLKIYNKKYAQIYLRNKFKFNKIFYKLQILYIKILFKQNNKVKYMILIQTCLKINKIINNKIFKNQIRVNLSINKKYK